MQIVIRSCHLPLSVRMVYSDTSLRLWLTARMSVRTCEYAVMLTESSRLALWAAIQCHDVNELLTVPAKLTAGTFSSSLLMLIWITVGTKAFCVQEIKKIKDSNNSGFLNIVSLSSFGEKCLIRYLDEKLTFSRGVCKINLIQFNLEKNVYFS